jgi:hypothetical protein
MAIDSNAFFDVNSSISFEMKNGIITSLRHVTDDPSRDAPIQEM